MGVALVLASILLIAGDLTVSDLYEGGIVGTSLQVASQSFIWFLVWLGGSMIAAQVQVSSLAAELGITRNKSESKK